MKCKKCNSTWEEWDDNAPGPLKCPECSFVNKPRIRGVKKTFRPLLGKALGKYSWCYHCEHITLNIPGKTYCDRPLSEHKPGGWMYVQGKSVTITEENQSDLFFACERCGAEKFWAYNYNCPVCDSDEHAIIDIGPASYNYGAAMEFGGNPQDWEETWFCLRCGGTYTISNGNY